MEGKGKPVDPSSDDSLRADEIPGMELELRGWGRSVPAASRRDQFFT